jgi:flagellar biosynthetic protein FliR
LNLFQFSPEEMMVFFAVLVRYSILFSLIPVVGEKAVPMPVKVLLSLAVTICVYPGLVKQRLVNPADAIMWSSTAGGIIGTIGSEVLVGILLGYVSRFAFDAITMGGNFIGTQMGFSMATVFDPQQESHTTVISEIHYALAMLAFLALDGHVLIIRAALQSYEIVGVGKGVFTELVSHRMIDLTGQLIRFAVQISGPVALVMFLVNIIFGVFSRAMPQMNILILSFAVTTGLGLVVMFLTLPEFISISVNLVAKTEDWMNGMLYGFVSK